MATERGCIMYSMSKGGSDRAAPGIEVLSFQSSPYPMLICLVNTWCISHHAHIPLSPEGVPQCSSNLLFQPEELFSKEGF
jgi:hypothetical protein